MDEIDCKIIVSNSHVVASKQVNILVRILKRCQLVKRCQIVKGCQIVTPKNTQCGSSNNPLVYTISNSRLK